MRAFFLFLFVLLVALIGGLIAAGLYFYDFAIRRSTKEFLRDNEELRDPESGSAGDTGATSFATKDPDWLNRQELETWYITSEDGLNLVGYYLPASKPTTKTAILAHGYTSQGLHMESFAWFYHELFGYNVLMPDARGHGQSEGDYIGFGWPERKDYLLWIQTVIDRVGGDAQLVLHGISMGGATVMMVSGEDLPSQVKVIVEDCGYTSAYDELAYQLKKMYNLSPFPIMPATSVITRWKAGYSLYEASALKQVKKTRLPILFIHGEEDRFVPFEMVWELYEACPSEKEIYVVKGAGHGNAYGTDRAMYVQRVSDFLARFIQ